MNKKTFLIALVLMANSALHDLNGKGYKSESSTVQVLEQLQNAINAYNVSAFKKVIQNNPYLFYTGQEIGYFDPYDPTHPSKNMTALDFVDSKRTYTTNLTPQQLNALNQMEAFYKDNPISYKPTKK